MNAKTLILALLLLQGGALFTGRAHAVTATIRRVYFSTPAFRDCYISIMNVNQATPAQIVGKIDGGDGVNGWTYKGTWDTSSGGYTGGTFVLGQGHPLLIQYTKNSELAGTFAGYLDLYVFSPGKIVANGYCRSEGTNIPFTIIGGESF